MDIDSNVLNQIAYSLANHYVCVYYVNLISGRYIVFTGEAREETKDSELPTEGENFFDDARKNAPLFIHPDDLDLMIATYDRTTLFDRLTKHDNYSVSFRTNANGNTRHMRHIVILCKDKKHIVCCLEDVENEYTDT